MAHYAYVDEQNVVVQVIAGRDENEDGVNWEEYYGAVRCSYNTRGGLHTQGGTPFRMNYPGPGWTFDPQFGTHGAFMPPQPYPSWVLNPETALWEPPSPYPSGGGDYAWNESQKAWDPSGD